VVLARAKKPLDNASCPEKTTTKAILPKVNQSNLETDSL